MAHSLGTRGTSTFPKEAFVLGIRYLPAIFPLQSLLLITGANRMERPAARPGSAWPAVTPIHPEAKDRQRFCFLGLEGNGSRAELVLRPEGFLRTKSAIPGGPE